MGIKLEEAKEMCKENYAFFQQNLKCLYQEFPDKFLVLRDSAVVGAYDTFDIAFNAAKKKYALGTFLIQECTREISVLNFAAFNVQFGEV